MNLHVLTNITLGRAQPRGRPVPADAPPPTSVGAFITPQSLASFPGAAAVITFIWKAAGRLSTTLDKSLLVPLALAIVVGALIYINTVSDPNVPKQSWPQRMVGIGIAGINALLLWASAIGVTTLTSTH